MSMPEGDPIFLRASVSRHCNLDCVYCPKPEGMENRVPDALKGQTLDTHAYIRCLAHIARQGILGISFTGGEPTMNRDLPVLIAQARELFARVELTTNGLNFPKMLPQLSQHLDIVKVSLDSLDVNLFTTLTHGRRDDFDYARAAIEAASRAGLRVGINVVAMQSTIHRFPEIVEYARTINEQYQEYTVYVSVLDFYYSPSRRHVWEREFVPAEYLENEFSKHYGLPRSHTRFGCRFFWFDANGVDIRLKDSFGATQRARKCENCLHYCQEGIYGLKLSTEGWVTTCPTGDPKYGFRLTGETTDKQADELLAPLISDIKYSGPNPQSFEKMLETHGLRPKPFKDYCR